MSDFIIDIANYISGLEEISFEDAQNIVFDMSESEIDNILNEMGLNA
jgi:flagellar motility protein MotE (MotC chaperone)